MHEYDSITVSHKHRKHSSVMVKMADSYKIDLGSMPDQVFEFFVNYF